MCVLDTATPVLSFSADEQRLWYVAFWALGLILVWRLMLLYGRDLVDTPQLLRH